LIYLTKQKTQKNQSNLIELTFSDIQLMFQLHYYYYSFLESYVAFFFIAIYRLCYQRANCRSQCLHHLLQACF